MTDVLRENENVMDDPVRRALENAPLDDESVTEEELERIRNANEDFKTGRTLSMDEIEKELGL